MSPACSERGDPPPTSRLHARYGCGDDATIRFTIHDNDTTRNEMSHMPTSVAPPGPSLGHIPSLRFQQSVLARALHPLYTLHPSP